MNLRIQSTLQMQAPLMLSAPVLLRGDILAYIKPLARQSERCSVFCAQYLL